MKNNKLLIPLIVLTMLFFMWGFITCMNDILIPYLKELFELNYFKSMLVQFSFFGAYFIGSVIYFFLSWKFGDPIMRIGYKNGIILGLVISAIGCALFFPASEIRVYGLFLTSLFVLAIGFTLLQIAANPFVAILGKPETASSRLNLSQAFNSLGTTIAPILGGYLVYSFFSGSGDPLLNSDGIPIKIGSHDYLSKEGIQVPYLFFSGLFLLLAFIVFITKLPDFRNTEALPRGAGALKYRQLRYGIVAIFLYVGAEVSIGSIFISYLKAEFQLPENIAKSFLAFYWGGAMIGRFLGAISLSNIKNYLIKIGLMLAVALIVFFIIFSAVKLDNHITLSEIIPFIGFIVLNLLVFIAGRSLPHLTLRWFAMTNAALLITSLFIHDSFSMWLIIAAGLFNSIMWSNIFTLSIKGLGKYTSQGSSLLVMAILGGAVLPLLQGAIADNINIKISFVIPLIGYLYLIWYGWKGYKENSILKN